MIATPAGNPSAGFDSSPEQIIIWSKWNALRIIARRVFLDRNALGMPFKVRAEIRSNARPHLRKAVAFARAARNALRGGDAHRHELMHALASAQVAIAGNFFREPFMHQRARVSGPGGTNSTNASGPRTSEARDEILEEFNRLLADGHTTREARGILLSWGRWSQSTIYRAT